MHHLLVVLFKKAENKKRNMFGDETSCEYKYLPIKSWKICWEIN